LRGVKRKFEECNGDGEAGVLEGARKRVKLA
jgi:hypothetical protein